jgi:hypothetical protein
MNFGLSENNHYNNHISACTTTDMHPEELANPDKLNHDLKYFDKYTYLNNQNPNHNNNDSDDEYGQVDDDPHNYTHQTNQHEDKHSSQRGEQKNSSDHNKKSDSNDSSDSDNESRKQQTQQNQQTQPKQNIDPEDESTWTKEEMMLRKLDLLRKLGELSKAGVKLSQNYSLTSDYKTMKFEYELHSNIRSKQNSLNWMSNMLIGIVKGVELLNDNVNPFDMKFDGMWSNEVKSDISNYYDVLGEIYEKYTTPGKKMAPELKLFLMLSGSAVSIQMHKGIANYMANNSNVAGDLEDDPDKISELRKKAAAKKEEQKKKIQEKLEDEHRMAAERMANINMLKKKEEEYNEMKNNAKNLNMGKFQNSLVLSESATARSAPNKKKFQNENDNIKQFEKIEKKMEQQMQQTQMQTQMSKELQSLANINKMISDKKLNERKVMAKKIATTSSSKSSKVSDETSSDSETESEPENVSKSASKNMSRNSKNDESCSASVASSRSYIIKAPNLQKMIGGNSNNSKDETSSVRPIGVVKKEVAEKMMNENDFPEITCSKSGDAGNKQKGRPRKISTK